MEASLCKARDWGGLYLGALSGGGLGQRPPVLEDVGICVSALSGPSTTLRTEGHTDFMDQSEAVNVKCGLESMRKRRRMDKRVPTRYAHRVPFEVKPIKT